jgi:hypothetical protein
MKTKIAQPALSFTQLVDCKFRIALESTSAVKSSTVLTTNEKAKIPEVMIRFYAGILFVSARLANTLYSFSQASTITINVSK